MANSKLVYPKPVSRKPLTGLKRSPADMANHRASYGGPVKEMVTTYDNGEKSTPYYDFDLSELTSRTPVKEALRNPERNATIPTPRRNLKYPDSYNLEKGYTGKKGTQKNDAAERQAETLKKMAKGGKVGTVMGEFKRGSLKSSSGQKVTNRKQAIAIAMSEAGKKMKKYVKGGEIPDGDVLSNRDIGKRDPSLNKRKSTAPFTMEEMKGGLSTEEINKKTRPFDKAKESKYASGGKVKKMADGGMSNVDAAKAAYGGLSGFGSGARRPMNQPPSRGDMRDMRRAPMASRPMMSPGIQRGLGDAARNSIFKSALGGIGGYGAGVGAGMGMKKGGEVPKPKHSSAGEDKEYVKKEVAFMEKKGAPKSMIKHEKKEAKGMKRGGMARGGGIESRGKTQGTSIKAYKKGGVVDGIAQRGKTKGKVC